MSDNKPIFQILLSRISKHQLNINKYYLFNIVKIINNKEINKVHTIIGSKPLLIKLICLYSLKNI